MENSPATLAKKLIEKNENFSREWKTSQFALTKYLYKTTPLVKKMLKEANEYSFADRIVWDMTVPVVMPAAVLVDFLLIIPRYVAHLYSSK